MNIKEILAQMCLSEQAEATPFKSAEDGTDYAVWKINDGNTAYVLKKASEQRQLPIRKHREERENGIASAVPFSHFSIDAVTFDISKAPMPL